MAVTKEELPDFQRFADEKINQGVATSLFIDGRPMESTRCTAFGMIRTFTTSAFSPSTAARRFH